MQRSPQDARPAQDPSPIITNRRRVKKSRGGCRRCKTRHIKCDEAKPSCLRCVSKGKECPGYGLNVRFSSKHERHSPSASRKQDPTDDLESGLLWQEGVQLQQSERVNPRETDFSLPSPIDLVTDASSVEESPATKSLESLGSLAAMQSWEISPSLPSSTSSISSSSSSFSSASSLGSPELRVIPVQDWNLKTPIDLPVIPRTAQPIHGPTFLLEYWFSRICPVFSAFDSASNPFRRYIDESWQYSPVIYHAMRSMAASYLETRETRLPGSTSVAVQARGEATRALRYGIGQIERSQKNHGFASALTMACFMLGLSSAWHAAGDLGLVYLETARALIKRASALPRQTPGDEAIYAFCREGLVYWEMIAAVVEDKELAPEEESPINSGYKAFPASFPPSQPTDGSPRQLPHPFTGAAGPAQRLVTQVLVLTRRQRLMLRSQRFNRQHELEQALADVCHAYNLEAELLTLEIPTVDTVEDTLDAHSPNWHFIRISEAYRTAGLLQLYRTFPDLAQRRLAAFEDVQSPTLDDWLSSLATQALDSLRSIPPTSGTRCTQPLVMVMASSELRYTPQPAQSQSQSPPSGHTPHGEDKGGFHDAVAAPSVEITRARSFVLDRLSCFERNLPQKPIANALQLVREVWSRLDDGEDVSWIDVMLDCHLETVFG
ncbi:hypothetical protein ASPZODRAFT_68872 [Penicilliopsis zonata CBS 506.65]|uniref:Zn(2)-C6 fungal-type domain-containing protein n=1 Tax=Penicilliopsis zonata CBS 506.65 TaxID=1073090 RepID=A0A1L9SEW9_9EURO|nr:hypothetical protein ASPZODRAFT_68872 [Penicilliopsis zonata CBS 506.65]OJJ45805.1 hypothetical protein ASPZODRAFT_68872 [Penicilliopsis zonata CBS 506.65]